MDRMNHSESDSEKIKKMKKEYWNKKNTSAKKTLKSISLNRGEKTPAQKRLLKFREENAKKVKQVTAKHPELFSDSGSLFKKAEKSSTFNLKKKTGNNGFSGRNSKRSLVKESESLNNVEAKGADDQIYDNSEEMDWEPSREESDVKNINIFRQLFGCSNTVSNDIFYNLNSDGLSISNVQTWFLVLDTNIFVSCISFVKELRDTKVSDLGYPVIYVPWRVLQELDHLKDTKIDAMDKNLHTNVRKAIAYLNDNFKSRHPRIIGQSFEEFSKMAGTFAPDDEILQTCIEFQKQQADKKLMLLTNDKNLESKAIVSGVEVYSKERFQKKFFNSNLKFTVASTLNKTNDVRVMIENDCLCEAKTLLKDFLSVVVEAEMKDAFEEHWTKIVVKKPPWTLQDVMDCLIKHWRSVYFLVFGKDTYSEVKLLHEKLFKKKSVNTEDIRDIIKKIQRLILCIKNSLKKNKPYLDLIPTIMTSLSNLLNVVSQNYVLQADSNFSTSLLPTTSSVEGSSFNTEQISKNEVSKVKALFKDIWDSLRSFCDSVSDVAYSPDASSEKTVQEMRQKLSQILNEVGELIVIVEKILLEITAADIAESHPLIIHFSNFLIFLNPNMSPELKNELPKCLSTFFTNFEGRCLLNNFLEDYKKFIQNLMKANEYLNARYVC